MSQSEDDLRPVTDMPPSEAEESEGEDIIAEMENDYQAIPELDQYETEGLDTTGSFITMDAAARAAAEVEIRQREKADRRARQHTGARRMPDLLFTTDDESDVRPRMRRGQREEPSSDLPSELSDGPRSDALSSQEVDERFRHKGLAGLENLLAEGIGEEEDRFDLMQLQGDNMAETLSLDAPRREVARRFRDMLLTRLDTDGRPKYIDRIGQIAARNGESLEVDYLDINEHDLMLAIITVDCPAQVLPIFDEVAFQVVLKEFPRYETIAPEIHVRITGLTGTESLRDIRQAHLNTLVKTFGVVTRRTNVYPQLKSVKFDCGGCGATIGPFIQTGVKEVRIGQCPNCGGRGPFSINMQQTIYRNFQRITVQETPGSLLPGRLPRQKDVILLWDLIDCCRPGEEIEITGIYTHSRDPTLNKMSGFPVFSTIIEANYIFKRSQEVSTFVSEQDKREILALAQDPSVGDRIVKSIAPSIYGHTEVKRALAISMFGGVRQTVRGQHVTRGDINLLLLGDPATAKSQCLKYVETAFHRVVRTTGKGASAVGLTAAVHKDPLTREWTLEGGALVLADNGICLIDEFDKMNDKDRTSIHEAMEQQSISISKAGIVTTLQARSTVIAAANPIRGRYDSSVPFMQNVDLTEPILSRFDIICVLKDLVDLDLDTRLSNFVIASHVLSHPDANEEDQELAGTLTQDIENLVDPELAHLEEIDQELLRKYIMYARASVRPAFPQRGQEKIASLYAELRQQSLGGGLAINVRHIESIVRIATAHAKMHLRPMVNDDDINMAIRVMLESYISTQKYAVMNSLKRTFRKYINYKRDTNDLLMYLLQDLFKEHMALIQHRRRFMGAEDEERPRVATLIEVEQQEFEDKAQEHRIADVNAFYASDKFTRSGFALADGMIRKTMTF